MRWLNFLSKWFYKPKTEVSSPPVALPCPEPLPPSVPVPPPPPPKPTPKPRSVPVRPRVRVAPPPPPPPRPPRPLPDITPFVSRKGDIGWLCDDYFFSSKKYAEAYVAGAPCAQIAIIFDSESNRNRKRLVTLEDIQNDNTKRIKNGGKPMAYGRAIIIKR